MHGARWGCPGRAVCMESVVAGWARPTERMGLKLLSPYADIGPDTRVPATPTHRAHEQSARRTRAWRASQPARVPCSAQHLVMSRALCTCPPQILTCWEPGRAGRWADISLLSADEYERLCAEQNRPYSCPSPHTEDLGSDPARVSFLLVT